jgi:hypothetical protein
VTDAGVGASCVAIAAGVTGDVGRVRAVLVAVGGH